MTRQAKLEAISRVLIDTDWGNIAVADLSRRILEAIER